MRRGNLRERSKGSWTITVSLGREPLTNKQKQRYETFRGDRRAAEKRLTEILGEVDKGIVITPSKETLGDFLERWSENVARPSVRRRTWEDYDRIVSRRLIPDLGHIPLKQLQPQDIESYYARLAKNGRVDGKAGGLSPRSVLHIHRVLTKALRYAMKNGMIARNVALLVENIGKPHQKEMNVLDAQGVKKLLEAAQGSEYYPILRLALLTGMRRSEILGLRWKDVDLSLGHIAVIQALHVLRGGQIVYESPKSAKSRRQIALSPVAVLVLKAHLEKQQALWQQFGLPLTPDCLVFSFPESERPEGKPILPNTLTHAYIKIARKAGLGGVRLHDLRHSHATLMLQAKVHPKIVQERLGHSSISITLDTYSHVVPGLQEAAALALDKVLSADVTDHEKVMAEKSLD